MSKRMVDSMVILKCAARQADCIFTTYKKWEIKVSLQFNMKKYVSSVLCMFF